MALMRRIALLLTAAALGAGTLPATAGAAPRATDFELSVGTAGPTARAAGATWTSKVLRPGRSFEVFGLRWARTAGDVHADVRVREDGRWRRWVEVSTDDSDGRGTAPVWAGGADAVQLRLSRRVRGLKVHFVQVRGSSARRAPVARAAQAPAIIPRAQWGADTECAPRDTPSYGDVQMTFVHHTVSANEYGPADAARMVLGICRFHRNGNGWDDIGYNFLVDKYGQVFEGRAGGADQAVVGAQAQGWNAQSTGIANLGTYEAVPQTDQALSAMASLIAWKLTLHGVPTTGPVTLRSAGGASNRYAGGTMHTFERISGHRDGNETSCPGAQLFAQLPRIRDMAAGRAPTIVPPATQGTKLTLGAARSALAFPEAAQLTGRMVGGDGAPVPNTPVKIQVLTARGFKAVSTVTTGADGGFATTLPTSRNRSVRALYNGTVSNTVRLRVVPALSVRTPVRRVLAKRRSILSGTVRPRKGTLVVEAALQRGPRTFRRTALLRVPVRAGRFRAAVPLTRPGLYRLRVRFAGDTRNAPVQRDSFVRAVRTAAALRGGSTPASGGRAAG